ncbi:MAG: hypothetical protein H6712_27970 [Myxococcales bacterium]|nr:hypothetical protein [Myxococcales bacterium]
MLTGVAVLGCGDDSSSTGSEGGDSSGTTTSPATDEGSTQAPMETTSADGTGSESSGPGAACGNGVVDPGEDCDDENMLEDDGCYSNCTIPYEELWTQTFDDGEDDLARDALFDGEGNLYVLGSSEVGGGGFDLWLRQYLPDGSEGFTWTYDGAFGGDDFGQRMAWHPSGDLMIVGSEQSDQGSDVLVIRLELSGPSVVWSDTYDGPDTGLMGADDDFGDHVAVTAEGDVLVAGTVREVDQEWNAWLRRYDGDGNELWTLAHDEAMLSDASEAVVVDAAGDIYHVGGIEVSNGDADGWVRKLDADGNEIWTHTIGGVVFRDATLDAEGNLVLTGVDIEAGTAPDLWLGKYDPDFGVLGNTSYDSGGSFDFGLGVAVGSGGDVYVAGSITVVGEQGQIWAARYQPNVNLRWWSHSYGNDRAHLEDDAFAIAINDDESRVAIVGQETVLGQGRNTWVRMLQNNPVPMP